MAAASEASANSPADANPPFIYGGGRGGGGEKGRRREKEKGRFPLFVFSRRLYCINTSFLFQTVRESQIKRHKGKAIGAQRFPFSYRPDQIESKFFSLIPSPRVDYTLVNG